MMPRTYEPIASQTLGSAASSVTFSSISAAFTDLILVVHAKTSQASTVDGICIRFNSDTGSNYSITRLAGSGSSAFSDRQTSATTPIVQVGANNSGGPTPIIYQIMSYANTSVNKTGLVSSAVSDGLVTRGVLLWRNTAAISTIAVFPENGPNFNTGSTFSLFALKAA